MIALSTTSGTGTAAGRASAARLAGLSGLAFGGGVVIANALMFGAPVPDASVAEAASWYETNRSRAMLASAMVALTFPALLIFGAGMFELGREIEAARRWMLVGAFGGIGMVGVFSIVAAAQFGSILLAGDDAGAAFTASWVLHNGAFAVNMSVLGTAFLGFAIGSHAADLTSSALRTTGGVGAVLLLITGFANAAVAAGSAMIFAGFFGFLLWLVWIVTTGIRLVRGPRESSFR